MSSLLAYRPILNKRAFQLLLGVSFLLHVVVELLLRYDTTFGERDSYRVFAGVLDAFQTGGSLSGALVYGYGISRGYFAFVELFRSWVSEPLRLAAALNVITSVSAIAATVPVYILGRRLAGPWGGILANVALISVPIWFYGSQYAHPMWPAMALFLLSLMFISLAWPAERPERPILLLPALLFLAMAITSRLDVLLMAPMFLMLALNKNRLSVKRVAVLLGIGILGLGLAFAIFLVMPKPPEAEQSALELLLAWHNPHRFVSFFAIAQLRIVRGIGPALLIAFALSVFVLLAVRNYTALLVSVPTVALNYVFWVPNPQPERHFLYLVPALALAVGAALATVLADGPREARLERKLFPSLLLSPLLLALFVLVPKPALVYLASVPILLVLGCGTVEFLGRGRAATRLVVAGSAALAVALAVVPAKFVFQNPYAPQEPVELAGLAAPLLALPPQNKPVVVISDAYPVFSDMLIGKQGPMEWSVEVPWIKARYKDNSFLFFIQGWLEGDTVAATEALAATQPIALAVDKVAAPTVSARMSGKANIQEIPAP